MAYKFKKLIGMNDFSFQFRKKKKKKTLHVTDVYRIYLKCYATVCMLSFFLTQSWLITMLSALIARRWVGRQTMMAPTLSYSF